MDSFILAEVLIIGYLLATVYFANQDFVNAATDGGITRILLYGTPILTSLLGLYILLAAIIGAQATAMTPEEQAANQLTDIPEIGFGWIVFALIVIGTAGYSIVMIINSSHARSAIRQRLPEHATFDPESIVHQTAAIFTIFLITVALASFAAGGGTEGVADQLEDIPVSETVIQAVVQVVVAVLGVGYLIRRNLRQMLARLSLRSPVQDDLTYGFGGGVVLYIGAIVFSGLLTLIFTSEQIEQQTEAAENLVNAFSTIPLALLLASSAAIGEEIFFRGAIQPVFGLIPTTLFFTLMHSQVLFTPGMLWIFVVGLALGWLRQQYSTTAAIFAHFTYNLIILLSQILIQNAGGV